MRLRDLIDLFLDDEDDALRPHELQRDEVVARDREDHSSLADIVRILREHDGRYDAEHDRR